MLLLIIILLIGSPDLSFICITGLLVLFVLNYSFIVNRFVFKYDVFSFFLFFFLLISHY